MAIPPGAKGKAPDKNREGVGKDLAAEVPVQDSGDSVVGNWRDGEPTSSTVSSGGRNADAWAAGAALSCSPTESAAASPSPGGKKTAARSPSTRKNGEDKDSARFPSTSNKGEGEDAFRTPSAIKNWEEEDGAGASSISGDDEDAARTPSTRKNGEEEAPCSFHRATASSDIGRVQPHAAVLSFQKEAQPASSPRQGSSLLALSPPRRTSEVAEGFRGRLSFIHRLLQCCGLTTVFIGEKSETAHVREKKTCVSQAMIHYHIEKPPIAEKLSMYYSSFRVVLGDGECFYLSLIFSYLEHLLDRSDTAEEDRLLCETENIASASQSLNWPCDINEHCEAFKELLHRVKRWKSETGDVSYRIMKLLRFFGDYRESDNILSFLRIASATQICTNLEFAAFHPITDGMTLEEHCSSEIIRRRSFADHLAIARLTAALDIQLRVFSLATGVNQDVYITDLDKANAAPIVTLVYTSREHYDILYPR